MNLKAETCVCGGDHWHETREPYEYCRKCGSIRERLSDALWTLWTIPLDRDAEMRDAVAREERERTKAKGKSGQWPRGQPPSGGKPPEGKS